MTAETTISRAVGIDSLAVIEAAHESILITDTHLDRPGPRIVYANPAFERMTGYGAAEIIGRCPRFLQGPETDLSVFADMRETLERGESWTATATNYRKDGTPFIMEWSIAPVRDTGGRIMHYMAVQKDVTQRVEDERRLIDALKAAQEADRAKIDFLAMMSHELRTPLNAIIGYSEMMQSEVLGPFKDSPYASYVDSVHGAGQELLRQVERILAYAQDGDGEKLQEDWVDMSAAVAESLATMADMAHAQGIAVDFDCSERILVNGDGSRLRRLIRNLVSNAIKFSEEGGRIGVTLEDGASGVRLSVTDHGPGMSESELKLATQPFSRRASAHDGTHGGTGLGLAIVKRVADLHDAELDIDSAPGLGTRASVLFPPTRCSQVGRLRTALSRQQFELYYQPKVRLSDGGLAGLEALLRWNDPSRGVVPPGAFLDAAEDGGMIREISDWVLEAACRQIAAWGEAAVPVSVNLSVEDFEDPALADRVGRTLEMHGVHPGLLELEITESRFMADHAGATANLDALGRLGVAVSIDDFGTGYSSLAYLKDLNVPRIKLDKSFVRNSAPGEKGFEVARATLSLAHALNLQVVAEGIETPEQRDALIDDGCAEGQGFLFARPLPAAGVDLTATYF